MKRISTILIALLILLPTVVIAAPAEAPAGSWYTIPTFYIDSVVTDDTVTIVTHNFPADDTFTVTMGLMGTRGIGGTVLGSQGSGAGGSFSATYDIPDGLKGEYQIAIRLESPTSGYYAYNWFYNNTAVGAPWSPPSGYGGIPTFYIDSVVMDDEVMIMTHNFPSDDTFTVTMGKMGTRGIGGIVVDSQDSGAGGAFGATYAIPDALKGDYQIAIRLESPTSGYYAYNWFYNNTTGAGGVAPPPIVPSGMIPTFTIQAVVRNDTVTISAINFPTGDDFTVTMGAMGTRGIGGYVVDSQASGDGSFSNTYSIPAALMDSYQIAIRLESATSGYYSYNWFYNNSTP
jgi:hypothetical protein